MKILNKSKLITLLLISAFIFLAPTFFSNFPKAHAATTQVDLGSVANFAVMGAAAISDTPTSAITGDVGLWYHGGASITGLTCGEITGSIYETDSGYAGGGGCAVPNSTSLLTTAHTSLTSAYSDAVGRTPTTTYGAIYDLGGLTLTSGIYNDPSSFAVTGTLTLDGGGDPNAVFIFQAGSTLKMNDGSKIVLTGSAQSCNVFWQVGSSATFGTTAGTGIKFIGNILAYTSITDSGGTTVDGRLLAGSTVDNTGAVTLSNTTVTKSTCAAGTPTPTLTPTPTPTSASAPNPTPTAAPGSIPIPASAVGSSASSANGATLCLAPTITTVPIIIESRRVAPDSIFISWGPFAGIDTFNVRYGLTNGNWLYNTNVTGFSTTINALPHNQPIWVQVAARNDCYVGAYGEPKFVGGPSLPGTGFDPHKNNIPWYLPGIFIGISSFLVLGFMKLTRF